MDERSDALRQIVTLARTHNLTAVEVAAAISSSTVEAREQRWQGVLVRVLGFPLRQGGTPCSTEAAQRTFVRPTVIRHEPSAYSETPRSSFSGSVTSASPWTTNPSGASRMRTPRMPRWSTKPPSERNTSS